MTTMTLTIQPVWRWTTNVSTQRMTQTMMKKRRKKRTRIMMTTLRIRTMSKTMMRRSNKMMTIKRMRVRTILMTLIRIHAQLLMESGLVSTGLIQPTTTRL